MLLLGRNPCYINETAILVGEVVVCQGHNAEGFSAVQALFAICHDPAALAEVAALAGKLVAIDVTAAGSVEWHEQDAAGAHCLLLQMWNGLTSICG